MIPKERSFVRYTQADINLMASHINSTARDGLNGKTPFDLAELLLDKRIPAIAGQFKVSPDEVMLKPELINREVLKQTGNHSQSKTVILDEWNLVFLKPVQSSVCRADKQVGHNEV